LGWHEELVFYRFGRLPTRKDFLVCPECGSKRRLFISGDSSHCFIDNESCIDWDVGKFSVEVIFGCEHRVLVCFGCPRLEEIGVH